MGICKACNKEFKGETYRCPECRIKFNKQARDRRKQLNELGICNVCGAELVDDKHTRCRECIEKNEKKPSRQNRELQAKKTREQNQSNKIKLKRIGELLKSNNLGKMTKEELIGAIVMIISS